MNLFNRRPSRAAVIRALREAEALWKPFAKNENARLEPGVGEAGAEGGFNKDQSAPHGPSNVIPFLRSPRACCACGQHLHDGEGAICAICLAWDSALRHLSACRQALGDLGGGV